MARRRSLRLSNQCAQNYGQNAVFGSYTGEWFMLDWGTIQKTPFRLPRKRGGLPFGDDVWLCDSDSEVEDFELPYSVREEVISEPPPPFKLIHANVYPSFIARVRLGEAQVCGCSATDDEHSCQPESGCLNRRLFQECELESCPVGASCQNRNIQLRNFPPTEVFPTCDGRGWGLRLAPEASAVPKGTILCEYNGEVVTMEECRRRLDDPTRGKDFYFASLDSGLVLDAKPMGSVARFANHSCRPNSELQKWSVREEPRVTLVASRLIVPGEELSYNYRADTLGGFVTRQRCYCGAPNCGGFIGAPVQEVEADIFWSESVKILGMKVPKLSQAQDLMERGRSLGMSGKGQEMVCLRELVEEGEAWIQQWNAACDIGSYELMEKAVSSAPIDLQIDALTSSRRLVRRIRSAQNAALRLLGEPTDNNSNTNSNGYSRCVSSTLEEVHSNGPTATTASLPQVVQRSLTPSVGKLTGDGGGVGAAAANKCFHAQPTIDSIMAVLRDLCTIEKEGVILKRGVKEALLVVLRPVDAWARECLEVLGLKSPARGTRGNNEQKDLKIINIKTLESALCPCLETLEKGLEEVAGFAIMQDEANDNNKAALQRRCDTTNREMRKQRRGNSIKRKRKVQQQPFRSSRRGITNGNSVEENVLPVDLKQESNGILSHPSDDGGVSEALSTLTDAQQPLDPRKTTTAPLQEEEVKKEKQQDKGDEESDNDEYTLHCLCRLPEHMSNKGMRTLVNCGGCRCWFHPACIHSTESDVSRDAKGPQGFLCPMCLHAAGSVSSMVTPSPLLIKGVSRKSGRKPGFVKLRSLVEKGDQLPVRDMAGLSFLHYILDKYSTWQAKAEAVLAAVKNYIQIGEKKVDGSILNTEKAAPRSGLDLPSVGRNLGFESELVECLGQMLCEGMPLRSIMDTSETDRGLQCMLWCLTASLLSPECCELLRASSSNPSLPSTQPQTWQLAPGDQVRLMESRSWIGMPSIPQLEAAWQSGKRLSAYAPLVITLKRCLDNVVELLRGGLSHHKAIIAAALPALKIQAEWFCIGHDYAFARALALCNQTSSAGKIASANKPSPPPQGQEQEQLQLQLLEENVDVCFCGEVEEGFMLACDQCDEWFHANCVGVRCNKVTTSPKFMYSCIACSYVAGKPYIHAWPSLVSLPSKRKKKQQLKPKSPPKQQMTEPGGLKLLKPSKTVSSTDHSHPLPNQTIPLISGEYRQ